MKKLFFALLLGGSTIALAQDSDATDRPDFNRKHEIRLDAVEVLAVNTLEFNYEYVLSKYTGLGAAISIGFEDDGESSYQNFAFTPYFRQYFFNKKDYGARGLFAEGLLQVASGEDTYTDFNEVGGFREVVGDWTNFGIGFALGQKWVSKNGFVLEISLGGGRYFGEEEFSPEAFFRGGVLVGYRF